MRKATSAYLLVALLPIFLLSACGGGGSSVGDDPVAPADKATGLQKAVAVESLSGSAGSEKLFSFSLNGAVENLSFSVSGGSGDADLYVRYGNAPSLSVYDCLSTEANNEESCIQTVVSAGTWYVMLYGSDDYSGVSLVADYSEVAAASATGEECGYSALQLELFDAHNEARATGRNCGDTWYPAAASLSLSCSLSDAANAHSTDMAANDFFDHEGSDGSSSVDRALLYGYGSSYVGENIAAGYSDVDSVMQGWLDSSGHCANIMRSVYTEMGAARVESSASYPYYWTVDFGRP